MCVCVFVYTSFNSEGNRTSPLPAYISRLCISGLESYLYLAEIIAGTLHQKYPRPFLIQTRRLTSCPSENPENCRDEGYRSFDRRK